ncbi:MAG: hypothetical protein ABIJ61_10435 [bacterium]
MLETLRRWRHTFLPLPVKYGRRFREVFELLRNHRNVSREQLEAYQWQQLKALLDYAYQHVPFYKQRFDSQDIRPEDIRTKADFRKLPILTKDDVIANRESLKSDEFVKFKPILTLTSGTTRDNTALYRSRDTEIWRSAVAWRYFFEIGYRFRDPRVRISIPLRHQSDLGKMPVDFNENALMIESHLITPEFAPVIYERIRSFKPKLIYCQPENLVQLIIYCREHDLEPFEVPLVLSVGEALLPEFKTIITEFMNSWVVDYYANRENVVAAGELGDGRMYTFGDYCYPEFLGKDGVPVQGKPGEIVSTSLVNYAFPLIRYNTDDIGIDRGYAADGLWPMPTMEMYGGRGKDLIVTRKGIVNPRPYSLFTGIGFVNFHQLQLEQLSLDEAVLRVVPSAAFDRERELPGLEKSVREYFDNQLRIRVNLELVDEIPRTASGKFKFVISDLAMQYLRDNYVRGAGSEDNDR